MEGVYFQGDAFSEYYFTRLLWDEPRLSQHLGSDTLDAAYRDAVRVISRAQRQLRAREQARSTRTLLLSPLCEVLGWRLGDEESIETGAGTEDAGAPLLVGDDASFARVRAIEPDAQLDLPPRGIHRRFAPSLSMVRVLEEQKLTWGILLNAYELRLIRRAEGFVSSHIGFDLTSIAEGSKAGYDAWRLLWAILRGDALEAEPPVLEQAAALGREHQEKVGEGLGRQVQEALVALAQGIVSHPANADKIPSPITAEFLRGLHAESLRLLYRILFALYGESRNLLPLDLPTYREGYAVKKLADLATAPDTDPRRRPGYAGRYLELGLRAHFKLLREGANLGPEGRIPKYNGALFDPSTTETIEALAWGDQTVAEVLDKLTRVQGRAGLIRLSYRELDVEQLGSIYENLLERELRVAGETMWDVRLDDRQLFVTAVERARLAESRGEIVEAEALTSTNDDEAEDDDLDEDDEGLGGDDEGGDEEESEEEDTGGSSSSKRRPLRVLRELAPGTVYLTSGAGRKQSGSFYTNRAIVEFLVREALDPLAEGKPPEAILALNVLDPAMGSGHFLVGACRRLAEHLLAAYREQYERVLAADPDLPAMDVFIEAGIHPEVARNWEREDDALTACRLLVAGNCLYGVDKNPLAVDLARVSLWLATAATDHPLAFLDHRLRVGDSLLGLPLYVGGDDVPEVHLLRPERPSDRRGGRGRRRRSEQPELFGGTPMREIVSESTQRLRQQIRRALGHLRTISQLMDDAPGDFEGHRLAYEAMQRELRPFWELHRVRIGREFLQEPPDVAEHDVVNRWLADISQHAVPSEEATALAEPARAKGEELGAFCWQLAFPDVFYDQQGEPKEAAGFDAVVGNPPWDTIKPNERECLASFDPTVWDYQGQERRRVMADVRRGNPSAEQAWLQHEAETKVLATLLRRGGMYRDQVATVEARASGGDPDTFKFFTERAYQLLRDGGNASIIVPAGLQGLLGCTGLRRMLLDRCQLRVLCKLDNERRIFPGVHHSKSFDLIVFSKGGQAGLIEAAFLEWETAEVLGRLRQHLRHVRIDADLYRALSPETYTFVEVHGERERQLLRRTYDTLPRLGDRVENSWHVSFAREFDMANDIHLFRDAGRLMRFGATLHCRRGPITEASLGAPVVCNEGGEFWTTPDATWYESQPERFVRAERWADRRGRLHLPGEIREGQVKARLTGFILVEEQEEPSAGPVRPGESYVPLYEGRMVHQYDHCHKGYVAGSGRRATWLDIEWPDKQITPHYFLGVQDAIAEHPALCRVRGACCDVTGRANERSCLAALVPFQSGCGHSINAVRDAGEDVRDLLLWLCVCNSFAFDFLLRLQVQNHASPYLLRGIPVPKPPKDHPAIRTLCASAALLVCTTPELRDLWQGCVSLYPEQFTLLWTRESACLDPSVRARLRAGIDGHVARLYGLTGCDYARILATFPLLDRDQPPLPGDVFIRRMRRGERVTPRSYVTRDLALLAYLEMAGEEPPADIVAFFAEAGVDIERQTGPIRDLRERVEQARRLGAVAYVPTRS